MDTLKELRPGMLLQVVAVPEEDAARISDLLSGWVRWTIIAAAVLTVGAFVLPMFVASRATGFAFLNMVVLGGALGSQWLLRQRRLSAAINLLLALAVVYITVLVSPEWTAAGMGVLAYAPPVIAAALLLTPEAAWVWLGIAVLAGLVRTFLGYTPDMPLSFWGVVGGPAALGVASVMGWSVARSIRYNTAALRREIRQSRTGVEIGHMVTSAVEMSTIIQQSVQMIQKSFGYYHVGLYMLDAERETVVLADAAGEAADKLKEMHYAVSCTGATVIGHAMDQKRRQVLFSWENVKDRRGRRIQFSYPRVPARGELAIPLQVGDKVYGVLDVMTQNVDAFTEGEMHILEGIGGHIANALEAARLYEERKRAAEALEKAYTEVEQQVRERTEQLRQETVERERLQQEIIDAQQRAIRELTTPIIPVMERIIVMPLIGTIDSTRAQDMTRRLLEGIREHRARIVIMDVTGVPLVDSGVADHLNKTIQAARLKGAQTIVTGVSDAVAETVVELGIDWGGVETARDLRSGLVAALNRLGVQLVQDRKGYKDIGERRYGH